MIMTGSNMDKARGILPWIPELMDLLNKQRPCATLKAGHMRPLEELSDTILGHVSQDNGSGSNSEWPSERTLLHLLSLSRLLQNPRKTHLHKFVAPLLLHTSLLKHLGLKQRRFPHVSFDKTTESEYKEFVLSIVITQYPYLNEFDGEYTRLLERKTLPCDVHDLFDGRLFRVVLYTVNSSRFSQSPFIPVHVERTLNILLSQLQSLCDGTSSSFAISRHGFGLKVQPTLRNICYPPQFLTVLPFSHPVFDHHFSVIKLEEDNNILQQFSGGYGAIFEKPLYSTHWHTIRPLVEKKGTVTVMKNKWALRAEQMQNLHKHKFASSLTGSAGNELTPERIYTTTASSGKRGKDSGSDRRQNMPAQASGQKGAKVDKKVGKKGVQVSKAEEIKRANALAKAGDRLKKAALAWKTFRSQYLESIPDLREKIAALDKLIPKCTESSIQLEVKLYRTRLLFKLWTLEYCMPDSVDRAGGYGLVALIFNDVRHLLSDPSLTKPMKTTVDRLWSALGFKQLQSLSITERSLPDTPFHDPTAFKDSAQDSIDTSTHIDLIEFQLKYCGPYMDRTLGSRDDSRVGFKPDAWQVNVLDAIDEDKSVFVVAPTSSGKTFIAFYAMEKVFPTLFPSYQTYTIFRHLYNANILFPTEPGTEGGRRGSASIRGTD